MNRSEKCEYYKKYYEDNKDKVKEDGKKCRKKIKYNGKKTSKIPISWKGKK